MVNDGSIHYDHEKDGHINELAGCEAKFRSKNFNTFISIKYLNYKLTVSLSFKLFFC